jgi:hypothetical protein
MALTVLGWLTLLLGLAYGVLGVIFTFTGTTAQRQLQGDPAGGLGFLLEVVAGFVSIIGVAFLLQGLLGVLAGLGCLLGKPWGRIPTYLLAVLAILWGVVCYIAYGFDAIGLTVGTVQVLYGILAFVLLNQRGTAASGYR